MIQAIRIEFPNLSNAIRQKIRLGRWRSARATRTCWKRANSCSRSSLQVPNIIAVLLQKGVVGVHHQMRNCNFHSGSQKNSEKNHASFALPLAKNNSCTSSLRATSFPNGWHPTITESAWVQVNVDFMEDAERKQWQWSLLATRLLSRLVGSLARTVSQHKWSWSHILMVQWLGEQPTHIPLFGQK